MLFSVEYDEDKRAIEIHLDEDGIESFVSQLKACKASGDHCHLKTPAWGGYELQSNVACEDGA